MRLILVRHGESEWNKIGRYQGQEDAPLSELGQQQAQALAQRLKREKLDVIYASPLQRANNTARAIAEFHPEVPLSTSQPCLKFIMAIGKGCIATMLRPNMALNYANGNISQLVRKCPTAKASRTSSSALLTLKNGF